MRSKMSVVVLAVSLVAAAATSALAAQGWLGVTTQSTDADLRRGLDLSRDGLLINSVASDSPADRAGLEKGDVILSYNSNAVTDPSDLRQLVRDTEPGRTATLSIWRDGERRSIQVRVGELPSSEDDSFDIPVPRTPEPPSPPRAPRAPRAPGRSDIRIERDDDGTVKRKMYVDGRELTEEEMDEKMKDLKGLEGEWFDKKDFEGLKDLKELKELKGMPGMRGWTDDNGRTFSFAPSGRGRLGVRVERLTDDLGQALGTDGENGVLVVQVIEDTPAQRAGIRAGDVIVRVGNDDVNDPDELVKALGERDGSVDIVVLRKGVRRTIQAELDQARTPRGMFAPNARRFGSRNPEPAPSPEVYRWRAREDQRSDADLREELRQLRRELEQLRREMGQRR